MQTIYYALIVVTLQADGTFYTSPKTPIWPYKELCQMWEKKAIREFRPKPNIKNIITSCTVVKFMDEETE